MYPGHSCELRLFRRLVQPNPRAHRGPPPAAWACRHAGGGYVSRSESTQRCNETRSASGPGRLPPFVGSLGHGGLRPPARCPAAFAALPIKRIRGADAERKSKAKAAKQSAYSLWRGESDEAMEKDTHRGGGAGGEEGPERGRGPAESGRRHRRASHRIASATSCGEGSRGHARARGVAGAPDGSVTWSVSRHRRAARGVRG